MELDDLKLAIEVARLGSFTAAARQRETDPSSVSRSIAALEAQTGIRLFHRSTRRLSLTDAGARYLEQVAPALEALECACDAAKADAGTPQGRVRITASVAFGLEQLVPLLPRLREALPEVELELLLEDGMVDLVGQGIDLAIRLAPAPSGDLISTRLGRTRYLVCASPRYLKAHDAPTKPQDLSAHACLRYALPGLRSVWKFQGQDRDITEVAVNGPVTISNAMALRQAACLGLGVALLADWLVAAELEKGRLVTLLPDYAATATEFDTGAWLLYPSRDYLPRRTRAVIDFLKAELI